MDRVQKIIAASGFCSRRKAEELIASGKVTVNGVKITLGDKAEEKDIIMVGKQRIQIEDHLYIMLNKPSGYITTRSDPHDRRNIMALLEGVSRPVYPVGRLDRDARGLLLLTSDGDFSQKVLHPSNQTTKTYRATLDKPFSSESAQWLTQGLLIDRRKVQAKFHKLKPKIIDITIHEGRNKIVKRIFKKLGYNVNDLKRVKIGHLKLDIPEGKWRELTKEEIVSIQS